MRRKNWRREKNLSPKGTAIVHRKKELSKVENEREAGG